MELGECVIAQARQFEDLAVEEIVVGISGQSLMAVQSGLADWYCRHESFCIPLASNPDHGGKSWRKQLNATMREKERNMRRFDPSSAVRQRMLRLKKRKTVLRRQESLRKMLQAKHALEDQSVDIRSHLLELI